MISKINGLDLFQLHIQLSIKGPDDVDRHFLSLPLLLKLRAEEMENSLVRREKINLSNL